MIEKFSTQAKHAIATTLEPILWSFLAYRENYYAYKQRCYKNAVQPLDRTRYCMEVLFS